MHTHLTGDVRDDERSVLELHAEHSVGQCLSYRSVYFDAVLFCHKSKGTLKFHVIKTGFYFPNLKFLVNNFYLLLAFSRHLAAFAFGHYCLIAPSIKPSNLLNKNLKII